MTPKVKYAGSFWHVKDFENPEMLKFANKDDFALMAFIVMPRYANTLYKLYVQTKFN